MKVSEMASYKTKSKAAGSEVIVRRTLKTLEIILR